MTSQHIAIVEDSDDDYDALAQSLHEVGCTAALHRYHDGEAALAFLEALAAASSSESAPCLLVLDLNLPRLGGRELLAWVKGHPTLHVLPVVVLTTSTHPGDARECYANRANAYHVKPHGVAELHGLAKTLSDYWTKWVVTPRLC